tara:strand:- start:320 stop:559 length:240 start_codon:yes stop_codon:yes gene_type:complete
LKKFWPHRSKAKGFSIENFANKYYEKISKLSSSKISNQFLDDSNLESMYKDINQIEISNLSLNRGHWANRDFSEYRDAA